MESNQGSGAEAAVSSPYAETEPEERTSQGFAKGPSPLLARMRRGAGNCAGIAHASFAGSPGTAGIDSRSPVGFRRPKEIGRAHEGNDGAEMKIIIFPAKFDKFTGFFDKFLKGVCLVTDCNHKGYHPNLSVAHSDMATKKVFRLHRICPQLPAFAPALHHAVEPSFLNRARPSLFGRVEPSLFGRVEPSLFGRVEPPSSPLEPPSSAASNPPSSAASNPPSSVGFDIYETPRLGYNRPIQSAGIRITTWRETWTISDDTPSTTSTARRARRARSRVKSGTSRKSL